MVMATRKYLRSRGIKRMSLTFRQSVTKHDPTVTLLPFPGGQHERK